ncbi:MAG: dTDP-4-dehydrorhamnose reductase [Thermoprotei archaeon]
MALVVGGSGQLGRELAARLVGATLTYNSNQLGGGVKLDLTQPASIEDLIIKRKPEVVVNAAAYTDVDGCEANRELALRVNALAVKHIVRAARLVGAYVVQVSTDYVFDGEQGCYREDDTPSPINHYGVTKLLGEAYAQSYDDSLVVRTSGVFGHKNNFPLFALQKLRRGEEVHAVELWYSPIHASSLAAAIVELVNRRLTGVIHVAGEKVSRYELACTMAKMIGADPKLVVKIPYSEAGFKARRPKDSSLSIEKAKTLVKHPFYSLEEGLRLLIDAHTI